MKKSAKEIVIKPIPSKAANNFVKLFHYSNTYVNNSVIHFGVFLNKKLEGVLSYGNPIDKRKVLVLVKDTKWQSMLELNRMAFSDNLPKNSESRAISITIKLIKKNYSHINWILSFADGTQCGDGTIYRASGFSLIGIKKNTTICKLPNGEVKARHGTSKINFEGAKVLKGFQLKYIYFINKNIKKNLTVPILPFSKIEEVGASMYKGNAVARA